MRAVLVASIMIVALLTACAPPKQQGLIDQIGDAQMSRQELRVRLRELVYEVLGLTKSRSYALYASATTSKQRWAALQIAVRSSELLIAASSHSDPVASLLDTWALFIQMRHLFESGAGQELFPGKSEGIVTRLAALETKIMTLATDLADEQKAENARTGIEQWALDNPLATGQLYRPSFTPELVGLMVDQDRNLFSVADTLDEQLSSVAVRLEILNLQLPQQIVWHAGMLIESRLGDVDINALAAQSERVMTMVEEVPQLIDTQREEIFRQIDIQRADTLVMVEKIRDDTLAEIDRQRIATIAGIDKAIATSLDRIHDESSLTVGQVENIAVALVDDINERVLLTVDRAFRRLMILVGVGLLGAAAIAVWSLRHPVRAQR